MTTGSQGNLKEEDTRQRASNRGAGARCWMLSAVLLLAGTLAILTGCGGGSDSSGSRSLSSSSTSSRSPSWSPNGRKLAFASDHDGDSEIYAVARRGGRPLQLTDNNYEDSSPSWSPDGRIAFVSDRDGAGAGDLYLMNSDGSDETRLTSVGGGAEEEEDVWVESGLAWSPDGRRIAFTVMDCKPGFVSADCEVQMYAIGADGSDQEPLGEGNDFDPDWSKSGLLASGPDGLVLYRNGSSHVVKHTADSAPSWSPDGRWIAYTCGLLCVMRADGSDFRFLTTNDDLEVDNPAWSPDGRAIAFERTRFTTDLAMLFTIRPNGTGLRKLRLDWK